MDIFEESEEVPFLVAQYRFVSALEEVAVVERTYPLEQIAEAMRHLGAGHALGKIVVTMGANGKG